MTQRLVDISTTVDNETLVDHAGFAPKLECEDNVSNVPELLRFLPGLIVDQLPGGEGWANETITLRSHSGRDESQTG